MTNQQRPITPPPELVEQWSTKCSGIPSIAAEAAQWGADQELDKCCEWLVQSNEEMSHRMRIARRPKPPSLKEQALEAFEGIKLEGNTARADLSYSDWCFIRRALEALPNE